MRPQTKPVPNEVQLKNHGYYTHFGKHLFESFVLILIFIPLTPFLLFAFIWLFISNRGKVIYKQKRIGLHGKEFTIYKFRTLSTPIIINMEKDPSMIREHSHSFAILLRKTGLDEVLQIINVIKGDMNLIGPRPLLYRDLEHLTETEFQLRHSISPGIIGLWQLRRKYDNDKNYYRYDVHYMKNISLMMDVYILLSTVTYVFRAQGR